MNDFQILVTKPQPDYELIDSGDGEKLERYGRYVVARPDPQALWEKSLSAARWQAADAMFHGNPGARNGEAGGWRQAASMPKSWNIGLGGVKLAVHLASFKHTGVFPEQVANWEWMAKLIRARVKAIGANAAAAQPVSVLNLFGYTGGASLVAAQAGAQVCHVDASKVAVTWGRKNAEISGLAVRPIRWIVDDAPVFLRRELKRGHKYDGILMDPPIFGRGPKGETWKIEKDLLTLLDVARQVLSPRPLFFLLNGYAAGYSAIAYDNNLRGILGAVGGGKVSSGVFEHGELTIQESGVGRRLLPSGIFARWSEKKL